jgi:two-component system NarL family sensor kinase
VLAVVDVDLGVAACLSSQAGDVVHLVREGLSNVGRHAGATTCRVGLVRRGGNVVLEIDDDGRGFELEQVRDRGQGLANLEARASALQGTMEIDTAPGEGTTLRVVLPA